jgi:hypothetical protein
MKYSLACVLLFGALQANAQSNLRTTDEVVSQLAAQVKEVTYLASTIGGGLRAEKEWYGFRLVKLADGTCLQIERTNFNIVKLGNVERPTFSDVELAFGTERYHSVRARSRHDLAPRVYLVAGHAVTLELELLLVRMRLPILGNRKQFTMAVEPYSHAPEQHMSSDRHRKGVMLAEGGNLPIYREPQLVGIVAFGCVANR